jgi:hypothetical protein
MLLEDAAASYALYVKTRITERGGSVFKIPLEPPRPMRYAWDNL